MREACFVMIVGLFFPAFSFSLTEEEGRDRQLGGLEAFIQGRYDEAEDAFSRLVSEGKGLVIEESARFWLVRTRIVLRKYGTAEAEVDRFLTLHPESELYHRVLYEKGRLLYLRGAYGGAIAVFDRYSQEYDYREYEAGALVWAGMSYYILDDLDTAYRYFGKVVDSHSGSHRVKNAVEMMTVIEERKAAQKTIRKGVDTLLRLRGRAQLLQEFYKEIIKMMTAIEGRKAAQKTIRKGVDTLFRLRGKAQLLQEFYKKISKESNGRIEGDTTE